MKKINKLILLCVASIFMYSCDTTNESSYEPAVYVAPATFSISAPAATVADNDFVVTYAPSAKGKGYYMVVPSGTAAPTSTEVHSGGGMQSGSFSVDGSTPVSITVDEAIYGAYTYDVYAIHKSEDNFISETVTKLSVTTPDTAAPTFDRDNTTPAHNVQPGTNSPFTTINLAFSEPVFYQGGDVTFTGFFGSRAITVNGASNFTQSGTTISIATHGTFSPDDAILVGWADGTFKDKSGKNVAALTGIGYYFWTRTFTIAEKAKLMPGMYDYSTVFYGGLSAFYSGLFTDFPGVFLPETGTFEITADTDDATGHTLKGVNLFSGFIPLGLTDEPETLPIVIHPTDADVLDLMPNVPSVITAGQATYWSHYGGEFFGIPFTNPGFYDFEAGTITHWVTLYGVDGSSIDDIDYIYTRIDTYAKGGTSNMDEARNKSAELKAKKQPVRSYKGTYGY